MLRLFLLVCALALVLVGLLTVVQAPAWSPWKLAVLAGEFGHWVALLALLLAAAAWGLRGEKGAIGIVTAVFSVVAAMFSLKPAFQAGRIAETLPEKLAGAFGPVDLGRPPFSVGKLFVGKGPLPVAVQPLSVSAGLPLDFYRATRADGRPAPCVIVVHGGGWDSGDRTQIPRLNHWLAGRGYAVAAISYRLAPAFIWPAQRDDLLAAMAYLKADAGGLGIDPSRMVLLGRSAGGQIALATGYAAKDPAVRGVVALYTPSDLVFGYANAKEDDMLKSPSLMRRFLGGTPESARANYESASGYYQVSQQTPPTLLLHGGNDALTWYRHSVRLDARLAENGVPHRFVFLPWATHAFDFNLDGPGGQLTTFALEWFLRSVTK